MGLESVKTLKSEEKKMRKPQRATGFAALIKQPQTAERTTERVEVIAQNREEAMAGIQHLRPDLARDKNGKAIRTSGGFPLKYKHFVKKGLEVGRASVGDDGIIRYQKKDGDTATYRVVLSGTPSEVATGKGFFFVRGTLQ